ncbi:TadE family protein [Quadrisphaera sp. DSM 44207]|uniref:TadE family protein n=1 Tax=Quadrisphaera sp. DSM 44207 TaxID=1881057 RepID=UPI00088680E9|nr:TadE family protein [Quadrisphaera sp. DSM 44207]SDQ08453.1 TadE-like protein [Quadrisphaera sp. DSM 44207]
MLRRVRAAAGGPEGDRGAAVPEFVMVAALVTLLFAGLLQLAFALHVRNTLTDSVAEGARFGALADRGPADGAERARELIRASLADGYAAQVSAGYAQVGGLSTVEVTATTALPVLGLLGPAGSLTVSGHGALEVLP